MIGAHLLGSWKNTEYYLVDETTNLAYPSIETCGMRKKSALLAATSPLIQLALSTANASIRTFKVLSGYHFWKNVDNEEKYHLKSRACDAGKDALRVICQPFAYVALEIVSLIGLFNPYAAMRAYFHIENAIYERPLMAVLLNFAPINHHLSGHDSALPKNKEIPPTTPEQKTVLFPPPPLTQQFPLLTNPAQPIPSLTLAQRMTEITEEELKQTFPNQHRYTDKCLNALAQHVLDTTNIHDFDRWFAKTKKEVEELTASSLRGLKIEDRSIFQRVAQKLIECDLNNHTADFIRRFASVPLMQKAIYAELETRLSTLNPDNPESFAALHQLIKQMPEAPAVYLVKLRELITKYAENVHNLLQPRSNGPVLLDKFYRLFHSIAQDVENRLLQDEKTLLSLLQAFAICERSFLSENPLNCHLKKIEAVLNLVEDISISTPDQDYFHSQLGQRLEKEAADLAELLENKEFKLQDESETVLSGRIKDAVNRINQQFNCDIEIAIDMNTQHDELLAILSTIFPNPQEWIGNCPATYDLNGFTDWLNNHEIAVNFPHSFVDFTPQTPAELYEFYTD